MTDQQDDYQNCMQHKRFFGKIEQGIRAANRQIIHKRIDNMDKDTILGFAVAVGRLRARYLQAAFKLGVDEHGNPPDREMIKELKDWDAVGRAAQEAVEKGYVDIAGIDTN